MQYKNIKLISEQKVGYRIFMIDCNHPESTPLDVFFKYWRYQCTPLLPITYCTDSSLIDQEMHLQELFQTIPNSIRVIRNIQNYL
jgi:hypothetical protein